jgi:uncharacterized protein YycO
MTKVKVFVFILLIAALSFSALRLKRKFYDPKARIEKANEQVKELAKQDEIREGDIIFQTSLSKQSKAIQLATHSQYSHCGLIYKEGTDFFVFEAIQPVKLTPLSEWIARGQDGHYVIKRLKNSSQVLSPEVLEKMRQVGTRFKGKNYDLYFDWSDDRIYCSELIWKVYKEGAGIEVGHLQKLKDFDLSSEPVKLKMKERYGDKIPMDETVISPVSIFESDQLITVKSN